MKNKQLIRLVLGTAMLVAGAVSAADTQPVVKATTKDDFTAVAAAIRQQIGPGGRWQYTSDSEKSDINTRLNDMQGLFDKFGAVDNMDQVSKELLYNDQEAINDILTKRDGNRLICSSEMPTGSHIPKRVCRTYAQMRADERAAQTFMRDQSHFNPQHAGGGG